jgi:sulfite reductase (ferredoxin)
MNLEKISPEAKKDVLELQERIELFKSGEIPEDKFKSYRLTRGVYGQRQLGVQMFRLKLPMGRITPAQIVRVADMADKYTNGNLHLTTRQNIQLHYIKLDDTPEILTALEEVGVTAREACGNTVRNITASSKAGIDPEELFDVSPYAFAAFEFFLRNPICQDMGRKIKPAFSSSEKDSAFTFLHDFGFIPRIQNEKRGFKVVVGGGLGAQAFLAQTAYEFLPEHLIIPFMEASLRVFDRYGERIRRHKARMKYLLKDIGLEKFMELVNEEWKSLTNKEFHVDIDKVSPGEPGPINAIPDFEIADEKKFNDWLKTNVFEQKQKGFFGVNLKITKGDISSDKARKIAELADKYAAQDMRITVNQGLLLKFVRKEALPYLYVEFEKMGFANPGFDSIADVTTCPGTDTCNLGVTNSMTLAEILEEVIQNEFYDLIFENDIKIKISGCMNSCGQHMAASIGLHGSSIKVGDLVAPAMQIVLGGGVDNQGVGFVGDKIIKLPTKKMPDALRVILNDYDENGEDGEYFNVYYRRLGKNHFYQLLKPLADKENLKEDDFFDYGSDINFIPEIGVGECAGVMYDMVGVIIKESQSKLKEAKDHLALNKYPEAIYYAYTGFVIAAKAILLGRDIECNTQIKILKDFDEKIVDTGEINVEGGFENMVLQINKFEPEANFANDYLTQFDSFFNKVLNNRSATINAEKTVIENHYKA